MSAQGGPARTQAASGNGQQPKKSTAAEIFNSVDGEQDKTPAQGASAQPRSKDEPQAEGNETVRIRPSLTSEAPPPPVEMPKKKSSNNAGSRLPRKAHLVLRRIEPWSAMKFSFVVSLVCFVVLFVAVAVLYGVLSALGVFDSLVDLVNQLGKGEQGQSSIPIDIASWFEPVRILGYTALIGAVNVVLITALSTLGAVIYNIASDLVGGVEVTFSEAE
ncbi:DUF3566 domain-containing protein [Nonomuraea spiralis]|uniref:DUF3566 domain-containing protein n=1 Tax=Nonomuraea spiralis TaxID=46182 RepID=A0ABV5IDE5_9ACTN|nr:DUF3566 domain-containing protein [Nonomuraea spiralis]GGS80191.1 hypothetical protein GCM10010176_024580 [Nonomuraea spiralis]